MQKSYELLVQSEISGDVCRVDALRDALALTANDEVWSIANLRIALRAVKEAERTIALEVQLPLNASVEQVTQVLTSLCEAAQRTSHRVIDVQLMRTVTSLDAPAIHEALTKIARHAGLYWGDSNAAGLSLIAASEEGMPASTKVALGLIAFFIATLVTFQLLTR